MLVMVIVLVMAMQTGVVAAGPPSFSTGRQPRPFGALAALFRGK
jgi:hypothetical protein